MGDIESYEDIERTLVAFRHVVSGLALDDAKSARNLFLSECYDDLVDMSNKLKRLSSHARRKESGDEYR